MFEKDVAGIVVAQAQAVFQQAAEGHRDFAFGKFVPEGAVCVGCEVFFGDEYFRVGRQSVSVQVICDGEGLVEFEYAHQGVAVVVIDRYRILRVEDDRNTDFGFFILYHLFQPIRQVVVLRCWRQAERTKSRELRSVYAYIYSRD